MDLQANIILAEPLLHEIISISFFMDLSVIYDVYLASGEASLSSSYELADISL